MRVLQSLYAFAGNAPPQLAVTRQLVGRGHEVLVLGHEAARVRIEASGATLRPFRLAYPDMDLARPETDPIRDWEPRTQLGAARRFRDRALIKPMANATTETAQVMAEWAPDIVVLDFLLVGVATAAEAAGIPAVVLVHCPYPFPTAGVPPFGSGWPMPKGRLSRALQGVGRRAVNRFFRPVTKRANAVRASHGLAAVRDWTDQLLGAERVLVLTAAELDFAGQAALPANVRYVGPAFEPSAETWTSPWPSGDEDPLIVVSLSTSFMDQVGLAGRVLEAVAPLPARVLFTTGPAVDPAGLTIPANTRVGSYIPHRSVLPDASVMVTHAGWQTVNASLSCGVPLVCIPCGRDQPDNARRVVAAGAGITVRKSATASRIRTAVSEALADRGLRERAGRMASLLGRQDGAVAATDEIESVLAARGHLTFD